jgi:hypothetical protein
MVRVSKRCLGFKETLAAGFGFTATFAAGAQTPATQRSAASADRGILASWTGLGQLTGLTTETVLAAGFAAALLVFFGVDFLFLGTFTITVLVVV